MLDQIDRAAVIGAGLMGRRIAGVMARAGIEVVLADADPGVAEAGAEVAREMASTTLGSVMSPDPGAITWTADLDAAVSEAQFVTEAVIEDVDIKRALMARLGAAAPAAILASNTSVLPISAIAAATPDPQRVVGTHWWNPPDLIPIVEVVRGASTSDATMDRTFALMTRLGKLPVRVERDVPGFVGNRLQHALWREAIALVAEGVCDAQTVDLVVRNTIGLRLAQMGPIENADYVGLDLTLAIHRAVIPALNADRDAHPHLAQLVAEGNLGAKTGQGFRTWQPGDRDLAATHLAQHIQRQLSEQDPHHDRRGA